MAESSYDLIRDEMVARVGKEGPTTTSEVDKTTIRMFARSVGYADPIYYDEAAAKAAGYRGLPCPPGYLGTPVFNPERAARGAGNPGGPQPQTALTRRLNAGHGLE